MFLSPIAAQRQSLFHAGPLNEAVVLFVTVARFMFRVSVKRIRITAAFMSQIVLAHNWQFLMVDITLS